MSDVEVCVVKIFIWQRDCRFSKYDLFRVLVEQTSNIVISKSVVTAVG
jgi:hypothetical protein